MANIDTYLQQILAAIYGEEVRGSIHDAIQEINNVVQNWESGLMDTTLTSTTLPAQGKAVGDVLLEVENGNITFLSRVNDKKKLQNDLQVVTNYRYSCTDYVLIPDDAMTITVSTKTTENEVLLPQVFYFDENKTYISRDSDQDATHDFFTSTIPSTAKYVRVNQPASSVTGVSKLIRFNSFDAGKFVDLSNSLVEYLFNFAEDMNISFLSLANDKKKLQNNLEVVTNTKYSCTDYILIPSYASTVTVSTKTTENEVLLPQVFYFDENKTYISRDSDQDATHDLFTSTIPSNAKYVRVNQPASSVTGVSKLIRFNGSNVEKIVLDLNNLKTDLFDVERDANISFLSLEHDNKYLNNQLVEIDATTTSCTDYVLIPSYAKSITVSTKTADNSLILPQVFYFDENKTYISRDSDQDSTHDLFTSTIPSNAKYVRVNQPASSVTGVSKLIRFNSFDISEIVTNMDLFISDSNLAPLSMAHDKMKLQNDLQLVGNSYYSCTDYIIIPEDAKAIKIASKTKKSGGADDTILPQVFFFDENKNYISRNSANDDKSYGVLDIPLTAKYVRVNQPSSDITDKPHLIRFIKYSGASVPAYQVEELPYNAVLYHQKWDELIQNTTTHVLRRISLGNVDDDDSLPIYAYEFSPNRYMVGLTESGQGSTQVAFDWDNALYKRPKILIIGGVHGNEKCTPMDILTVARMLKTKKYNDIACKFDWYFIPLVNPWGYSHARLDANGNILYDNTGVTAQIVECSETINAGIRNNSHGQNINRDWSDVVYTSDGVSYGFQTPELQLIKDYVIGIKPDFFIDAHQNHTNKTATSNVSLLVLSHAGAPIDESNQDPEYIALMRKIYRYIDIANADTNEIALGYDNGEHEYQTCRIWPTIRASDSEHYFGGVTVTVSGTVIGNTQHQSIATPYSICSETSEICANFSGTESWYNPVAREISYSYLWNIIKQISKMF